MSNLDFFNNNEGFSQIEYINAENIMKSLDPSNFSDNDYVSAYIVDSVIGSDYQGQCVKQPQFYNSVFNKVHFDGINGISSKIINCTFNETRFKDSGMTNSDFSNSKFLNMCFFDNCGCNKSNFSGVEFNHFFANASVFDEGYFVGSKFVCSEFAHCSFENAQFKNCVFEQCDLIHGNLEYSTFVSPIFNGVVLPFWGILKSFGLLPELKDNMNVTIKYAAAGREIQVNEFFDLLIPIQPYLYKKEEFFALANINIFLGHQEKALVYILMGLDKALKERDFRTIRYLCKLSSINYFFTKENLKKLYNAIIFNSHIAEMNNHEYQIYLHEVLEIKRLLIDNPFSMPQMTITCHTNFNAEDYNSWICFIKLFETTVKQVLPQSNYYFSVRHNSPPLFEFFLSDSVFNLYEYIIDFIQFCAYSTTAIKFVKHLLTVYKEYQSARTEKVLQDANVEKAHLENALLQEKIRSKQIETEMSILKLEERKKQLEESPKKKLLVPSVIKENIKSIKIELNSPDEESLPLREYYIEIVEENDDDSSGEKVQ